jgi:hypothetical protein
LTTVEPCLAAMAGEYSRMAVAALETVVSIVANPTLPRSKGWATIQWYYASFFAAHALLRAFGVSLTQLDQGHIKDINTVCAAWGQPSTLKNGFHKFSLDARAKNLSLDCLPGTGGTHEIMWKLFTDKLADMSKALLVSGTSVPTIQHTAATLDALRQVLRCSPSPRGAWLSYIRNRVNYQHEMGAWFPYHGHVDADTILVAGDPKDLLNALDEPLPMSPSVPPLVAFRAACRYIVALCISTAEEMERRCPAGTSFQSQGVLYLWRLIQQ